MSDDTIVEFDTDYWEVMPPVEDGALTLNPGGKLRWKWYGRRAFDLLHVVSVRKYQKQEWCYVQLTIGAEFSCNVSYAEIMQMWMDSRRIAT